MTAAQAVAVACLITVADESGAGQALRRVPGLAHAPLGQVHKIARWLRQSYPAGRPGRGAKPGGGGICNRTCSLSGTSSAS